MLKKGIENNGRWALRIPEDFHGLQSQKFLMELVSGAGKGEEVAGSDGKGGEVTGGADGEPIGNGEATDSGCEGVPESRAKVNGPYTRSIL
ncbi:hypothetical protein BGX27_001136 [Mortierella sp. AM989]|nr:hypothetical protein BGX27_001136 [Mortierella sp. AM989]